MRKILLLSIFSLFSCYAIAQVGVGTDLPNPSTQLDVEANDKGILIPRIQLASVTDQQTITAGNVESLLVFNTETNAEVVPGYYFWYDGEWRKLLVSGEYSNETITFLTDNADGTFIYTNEDGTQITFDANTVTYTDNNDGSYTFTNANGDSLTIDVVGDVVTNIQNQGDIYDEIINMLDTNSDIFVDNGDGTFTHTAVDGTQVTFDANTVTYTDNGNGSYTFTNANGQTLTIDVVGDVVTNIQNQGDVYDEIINMLDTNSDIFVDNGDGTFTHTAVDGTQVTFDANTVTYTDNGNGSYTFTNDNGQTLTVDVVGDVVTNIQNQGDIYDEIINMLDSNSDIFVDNGDGTFTHTSVDGTQVTFDANTVTYTDNNDGSYTFTNANGQTLTVDVVGDVVTNIQNQGDIYDEIINMLDSNSDIFIDNGDGTFTHTAVDGTQVTFDANTVTYTDNGNGSYTFTNANGQTLTIDVVGDVVTNIQNQGDIYDEIINMLDSNSDIFIENGDGTFTHTAVDGTQVTFDANTVTYNDNGNGSYTFTNANGDSLTIDVVGDVVTNIQNQGDIYDEIINMLDSNSDIFIDNGDGTFTHTAVDGTQVTFDANTVTYTDNNDGSYTFTNANGDSLTIDLVGDVVTNIQNQGDIYDEIINMLDTNSDVFVDNGDGTFTHTAVDGTQVTFDANTVTYTDNGNGSYTFTNANGDSLTIDVVGDVVTNIQNQGDIYDEIINMLDSNSDIFLDNGDGTFTHTSVDGTQVTFDANTVTYTDNNDGRYTFTNANGQTLTVDVVGDVVTNIQNQGDIYDEIINMLDTNSDVFVDNGDGTFTHTAVDGTQVTFNANTVTYIDNSDGSYTFTNANGQTLTIDVVGDVVTNIQNQGDIYDEIINMLDTNSDVFVDNGDGTFTHTAVDGTQVTFDANTVTYTDNGDGSYTFTNANGDSLTIDVVGDVVTNIQNQGDIYDEIINMLDSNSDIFVDNGDGTFTHTAVDGTQVTFDANTVTYTDNGNGSYTFTNANGDSLTIDVVGDVVTNIQNQGDIYDEIINILDTNSDIFADNGDGTFTHTAVDGTQVTFDANTVTYTDNGNGSYTFTNANGQTLTVEYFAENGLSQNNNTFQLGGNLIQPTAITTTATNTLAIEDLQDGHSPTHDVVVMDAQGILKKVKAAMPKFFYMPSILVPTSSDQVPAGETYGVIDLYDKYQDQFGGTGAVPLVTNTSNAGNTLPVLPATELNYYVTWYDTSVFYNVSISNNGVLNYSVYNTSAVTESSFMNIVFEVK